MSTKLMSEAHFPPAPIKFANDGERVAWDRYAAGVIRCVFPNQSTMQNLEMAAEAADEMLRLRRLRDQGHYDTASAIESATSRLIDEARNR